MTNNVPTQYREVTGQPLHNAERLAALYQLGVLDTPAEEIFDRLTQLASRALTSPVTLMTLVDSDRQFFKSQLGLKDPWASRRETPLSHSFCQHVVTSGSALVISDARTHPLVEHNLAIRDLNVIAYAGTPLKTEDGFTLGSFCAIDSVPRDWTADELEMLSEFSAVVMKVLKLRLDEARTRAIYDHISDVVVLLGSTGDVQFISSAVQSILGRPQEDFVGRQAIDFVHPDDRSRMRAIIAATFERPGPGPSGDVRIQHENGSWCWFELASNNRIEEPSVGAVVITGRDITDRKAQHLARERLAAIVGGSNDAIIGQTLDGVITSWNAAAERLYGYSSPEISGQSIETLVPDGQPSNVARLLTRVGRGEYIDNFETQRQAKDGRLLDVALTLSPIRDTDGAIVGVSTIARDVTERNRLLAERDRLHADLQGEYQRAAKVQAQLLPSSVPNIANYSFVATSLPAREIGGDFFDWTTDDGRVRLSLGDVTGKGMAAALLMATARAALRSVGELPLAEAVTAVNRALTPDLAQTDSFVTLFHADIDERGALRFVDAGHGMAYILRHNGDIETLHRPGLPLGIRDDEQYDAHSTQLGTGDTLIVFSDGLPDARPDLWLNPAGVATACAGYDDPGDMLSHLVSLAGGLGQRPDDLTIVLVRRHEADS